MCHCWLSLQAIRLDPSQPLNHLGTAQVYLAASGEVANVVSELELVLKALPGRGTGAGFTAAARHRCILQVDP